MISLTDMKNSYIIIAIKGERKALVSPSFAKLTDAAMWANHKAKQLKCVTVIAKIVGEYNEQ